MSTRRTHVSAARLSLIVLLFCALYGLSIMNLFRLQIKENNYFSKLAQQQYQVTRIQSPPRALIYDRNGIPLALNKDSFAIFITPNNMKDKKTVEAFLKKHYPSSYDRLKSHADDLFMYVKRRLTPEEMTIIINANLPDLYILKEPSRYYPAPTLGHTVGTTDIDNKGISGIELLYNDRLSGTPTTFILEQDARSHHFYFKKDTLIQGAEGQPVQLTLDADIQFLAYEELKEHCDNLGAQEGEILIMDATQGDILAMACYPDFDPNEPINDTQLWKTKNRIMTEAYEFGSVMKIFPALAALEEGVVQPDEMIECEQRKETFINGMKVTTWKACGLMPYTDVIRYSNNIGTSKVALRIGKPLYDHYKKAGFGKPTGVPFMGEQSGFITHPKQWSKATPLSLSFGYEISATLLQLARGFSLLANDGKLIQPKLFIDPKQEKSRANNVQIYSSKTITIMRNTINLDHEGSTSSHGRIPGYTILGKTGSAYLITNGSYDTNRSIYTFAGILEKGDYKRIIVTFIREPKPVGHKVYAATVAVPLFKRVAQAMLIHDKIV
jgi:cell division protein FtsI (penicillin-binding protein 3)